MSSPCRQPLRWPPSSPRAPRARCRRDGFAGPLPPLPWTVVATTSTGRVPVTFTVNPGDVTTTRHAGGVEMRGRAARVDLSCGRLDVWAGPRPMGPVPGPGVPGDCEP